MKNKNETRLIEALRERAPRAMHVGELLARAGMPKTQYDDAVDALERMCERGMVGELPGKRYRFVADRPRAAAAPTPRRAHRESPRARDAAPARKNVAVDARRPTIALVRGVLALHPRGFAFVAAEDGLPDVHVPATEMGPALHGDRVEVEAITSDRGREGRVVGIVQRRNARLVGSLHGDLTRRMVFNPGDPRLPETMRILQPIPDDVLVGDAVVARIREYPQSRDELPGVEIVERLGAPGDLRVEVARVLARDGVVDDFPEAVLEEEKRIPKRVSEAEAAGRRDLRDVPLCTIDPDDARDHDDALYAERLRDGGYRLVIAIADVSHYVRPGTAIDDEALARCTSIYLPDRAIPMLPRAISSKIASLLPGEDRLCMGVEVDLGPTGIVRDHVFFEGVMRSRARVTYGGAARVLGLTNEGRKQKEAEAMLPSLTALLEASRLLRKKRERRGSIDFDLPESKIVLGEDGGPADIVESRRDPGVREAYRLVEEMMLLANELVAAHLADLHLPTIHRIHPPPEGRRIELFCQLAQSLGYDLDPEEAVRPKALARFIERTADSPEAPFLRFLLLRAMQQASYSLAADVGHFGLAARDYLHFTSPIRRYPDLAVHRVLRAWMRREPIDRASLVPKLRVQAVESSRLERRAMVVSRDVVRVYEVSLMRDRVGDVYEGSIGVLEPDGFVVRLDSPFVEVSVELARFSRSRYELDALGLRLSSRSGHSYGVGDRIRLRIVEANMNTRRIVGVPVTEDHDAIDEPRPRAKRGGREAPKRHAAETTNRARRDERPARSSKDESSPRSGTHPQKARRRKPR